MLKVLNIKKTFSRGLFFRSKVRAVDDVSLSVEKGETLGLVGESGCGKSTLARVILNLLPPDSGSIILDNRDITRLRATDLKNIRRKLQIISQQPFSAFNPLIRIEKSLLEPLVIHGLLNRENRERMYDYLNRVGLHQGILARYPHEASGGELQRLALARALLLSPDILILDEPTSMLDVSMQATILSLLKQVRDEFGMSFVFISHDLDVINFMSNRIAVMKQGRIVEQGRRDRILNAPEADYTKALLDHFHNFNKERSTGFRIGHDAV